MGPVFIFYLATWVTQVTSCSSDPVRNPSVLRKYWNCLLLPGLSWPNIVYRIEGWSWTALSPPSMDVNVLVKTFAMIRISHGIHHERCWLEITVDGKFKLEILVPVVLKVGIKISFYITAYTYNNNYNEFKFLMLNSQFFANIAQIDFLRKAIPA